MRIKKPSAKHLSNYLDENAQIPHIGIDAVLKSVGIIESMINGSNKTLKEIVVQINNIS